MTKEELRASIMDTLGLESVDDPVWIVEGINPETGNPRMAFTGDGEEGEAEGGRKMTLAKAFESKFWLAAEAQLLAREEESEVKH